jgi:periplasmic protein CpxP/Spy
MKRTKLSLIMALGMASCFTLAAQTPDQQAAPAPQSQQSQSQERMHHADPVQQAKHLAKKLNLTADQENQIEPILANRQQQFEAIRSDSSLSRKDRFAKMRTVRQDTDAKIKAVLTDDQKQQYDQMLQQMHQREMQRRQEHQQGTGDNSNS